ncbi:MAG: HEAT repeat domain-containing protein, partial [bacterium]|nr:HEAT repeat domain-containing protein [bacterium]
PESPNNEKVRALGVLSLVGGAKFDREPYRPLVLPLLKSANEEIRANALLALLILNPTINDLDLVFPLAEDLSPEARKKVALALIAIGRGKEKERVIPALMKLLQDSNPDVVNQSIRSMWGQYSSPEFDALLIKLSDNPLLRHNVIYFGLSPMQEKSLAVCRRLVEALDDPDWNTSYRAAWVLTYGVSEVAKSLVEEGLLKALKEEINESTRREEFRALRYVATEKSRAYLESVVANPLESEKFQELARQLLVDLNRKRNITE